MTKFYNGIDLQGQKAIGVADPTAGTDAANKQYVDNLTAGLPWKQAVRVATTTAGTLATDFDNGTSIDGVSIATGDRILIKNQVAGEENGIYIVAASGAPSRATDADTAADLSPAVVSVEEGTTNQNTAWQQTAELASLATAQVWSQFNVGQTYTAGDGLDLTGSEFSVQAADSSITVGAGGISTSRAAIGATGKYAANVGAITGGNPITINHALNSEDVHVQTQLISTGEYVDLNPVMVDADNVTLESASSHGSGTFRVIVIG